jgi:O-antigen/teichoic acid export membrane protein
VAPLFVSVFYGPVWAEAGPLMQVLALAAAVPAIGWNAGDIARAVGRARLQLALVLIPAVLAVPVIRLGAHGAGLVGATGAFACLLALQVVLNVGMLRRLVRLPVQQVVQATLPGVLVALAVAASIVPFLWLTQTWQDEVRLAVALGLGTAAGTATLAIVGRDALATLLRRHFGSRLPLTEQA